MIMEKLRHCRESTIIRMVSMIIIVTKMVIPKQSAGTALRNPHRFLSINSRACTHTSTQEYPRGSGGFISIQILVLSSAAEKYFHFVHLCALKLSLLMWYSACY